MEDGNKLATLSGDILLASASLLSQLSVYISYYGLTALSVPAHNLVFIIIPHYPHRRAVLQSVNEFPFPSVQVVEIMSAAIAGAVEADFSDLMQFMEEEGSPLPAPAPEPHGSTDSILTKWLEHIALRHGAVLGTSCEA
ncbi:unnamed protein product, partial [Dibothriocephalus latus]